MLVDPVLAAAVLVASAVLTFAIAAYSFDWDRKNTTRRGHPALALLAILPFIAGILASQA